jgi:diguanylate cyclase (GGDEF)-like protein
MGTEVSDELSRLRGLQSHQLAVDVAEESFDDIVILAAAICGFPIALVGLLEGDEVQMRSAVGLPVRRQSRVGSFCAVAAARPNEVLMVHDATKDPRFQDHMFVVGEPHLRCVIGIPILSPTGEPLGALCVADTQTHSLSTKQLQGLRALGRQVTMQLELTKTLQRLRKSALDQQIYQSQLEASQARLESANSVLSALNMVDAVTELNNRGSFEAVLASEAARARRTGANISVASMSLDGYEAFAAEFGAQAARNALKDTARLLRGGGRPYDTHARMDEDCFGFMLPDTNAAGSLAALERIRRSLERHAWAESPLTASIGIATARAGEDVLELWVHAENARMMAIARGGNRSVHAAQLGLGSAGASDFV